jgi:hypothetical protein
VAVNVNHRTDLHDEDFTEHFKNIEVLSCAFCPVTFWAFEGLERVTMLDVRACEELDDEAFHHLPALEAVCIADPCSVGPLHEEAGDRVLDYYARDGGEGWAVAGERCSECPNMLDGGATGCRRSKWMRCVSDDDVGEPDLREYLCSECRAPRACELCHEWECRACLDIDARRGDDEDFQLPRDVVGDPKPCAACGTRVCRQCARRCESDECERHWCASHGKRCYGARKGYECEECQEYDTGDGMLSVMIINKWVCDECAQRHKMRCPSCSSALAECKASTCIRLELYHVLCL